MTPEPSIPGIAKGEQSLSPEDEKLLDSIKIEEIDPSSFPLELVTPSPKESNPEEKQTLFQRVLKMDLSAKIRLAMMGNQDAREMLIHDPNRVVALAVLRNPRMNENEVLMYTQHRTLHEEVLLVISRNKNWIKNYLIKLALVANPKTPLATAIRFLDHLHDKDLLALSKNKNVSSVVARAAARVTFKRSS